MKSIKISILYLFALLSHFAIAQQVQVIDRTSKKGIGDVLIFSSDTIRHTTTDDKGFANLSVFLPDDLLTFRHSGYRQLHIPMAEIENLNGIIMITEKVVHIDEIIISANKWEQNPQEIPNEMLAIHPEEIFTSNAQTSADLLEQTGQVFVQKSQLGGGSPMIRGFAANSVLLVVDGIRMNNAIFRSGNLQNIINIDPNMLQSSEVLFGPGSVIYGSDALGGVMDFHTLKPEFNKERKLKTNTSVWVRYASANQERIGHVHLNLKGEKISYLGGFSYSKFNDLITGSVRPEKYPDFGKRIEYVTQINDVDSIVSNENVNRQIYSGYSTWSTLQKLRIRLGDGMDAEYAFYLSKTTDIPRYDRLTEYNNGQLKYANWYYGPQNWMMNTLRLHIYKPQKWFDEVSIVTAWQQFHESRHDRKYRDIWMRHRKEKVNVYSLNIDLEKSWTKRQILFYGLKYILNDVQSSAYRQNIQTDISESISTRYPDEGSNIHSFAFYGSYKKEIATKMFLSAGGRFSYSMLNARFSPSSYFIDKINNGYHSLSGSLGIVHNPGQDWNLNFMISTGFRAPNIDDIAKVFDSEPGNVIVPNPDLKPEYTYNIEARVSKLIANQVKIGLTGFYSFLRDAMVRRNFTIDGKDSIYYDGTLSRVQALVNTGRANIYGGNVFVEAEITPHWFINAYLNYTHGEDLEEKVPLRHTTPLFGKTSVEYKNKSVHVEFYVRFNGARSFEDLPPSEQNKSYMYSKDGSPAWYTLNLRGYWEINTIFQINMALDNLLDHHYRPYSSGISAAGRNLIITLKATF